jgi:hypothetical protein
MFCLVLTLTAPTVIPTITFKDDRGIAQSGSAPALGAGCRGFKSLYPELCVYAGNYQDGHRQS